VRVNKISTLSFVVGSLKGRYVNFYKSGTYDIWKVQNETSLENTFFVDLTFGLEVYILTRDPDETDDEFVKFIDKIKENILSHIDLHEL
jgi:lipocalin